VGAAQVLRRARSSSEVEVIAGGAFSVCAWSADGATRVPIISKIESDNSKRAGHPASDFWRVVNIAGVGIPFLKYRFD
jgi:hypothetical protein